MPPSHTIATMSEIAIPFAPLPRTGGAPPPTALPALLDAERKGLTKKEVAADHPTWCPGCGDFSVLALYFKLIEKRKIWHEKITTVAGIGCSSRFPYFVQAHGVHYIHGRALPFSSGISLSRPDLHVFAFGGDNGASAGSRRRPWWPDDEVRWRTEHSHTAGHPTADERARGKAGEEGRAHREV
jgi:hypothetical protein